MYREDLNWERLISTSGIGHDRSGNPIYHVHILARNGEVHRVNYVDVDWEYLIGFLKNSWWMPKIIHRLIEERVMTRQPEGAFSVMVEGREFRLDDFPRKESDRTPVPQPYFVAQEYAEKFLEAMLFGDRIGESQRPIVFQVRWVVGNENGRGVVHDNGERGTRRGEWST